MILGIVIRDKVTGLCQLPGYFHNFEEFCRQIRLLPDDNLLKLRPDDFEFSVVFSFDTAADSLSEAFLPVYDDDLVVESLSVIFGGEGNDIN